MTDFNILGNSGCDLKICHNNGVATVIKSTNDVYYLERLKFQHDKQKIFSKNNTLREVTTPEIINEVCEKTRYSFEMEFVNSLDFLSFIERTDINDVYKAIDMIVEYIDINIKLSCMQTIGKDVIFNKYLNVKNIILKNGILGFADIFADFENRVKKLDNSINIPIGSCHGDLTLSNILINKKKIVLIDFLDSFIESPLMDIVKLRQDTKHAWIFNMVDFNVDYIKSIIALEKIDNYIVNHFEKYNFYEYYAIFQQLNLLRIVPYAKQPSVIAFLNNELEKNIDYS
jgi:thiamine kinase-like enzyme